jgi:UDP-glucose 4-epimerase
MIYEKNSLSHLASKKILITGASGFIGFHLSRRLCEIGAVVYGTSRIPQAKDSGNLIWLQGSFDVFETAKNLIKQIQPDMIFHLAGDVTASNEIGRVLPTFHSLLTSTVNLLVAAQELGCERIILTGSSTEPLDDKPYPNSPYAAAKWGTRAYGQMFKHIYNSPVIVVRPFMGYGPYQPKQKLIPHVILSLLRGDSPKLTNGLWLTDWIYIEDMVEGILTASITPNIEGQAIDLGTGILTSVREIIEKIVEIMKPSGKPLFGALPDRHEEHTRLADTEYTFGKTGWRARTSLEEGLKKGIDYYVKEFALSQNHSQKKL